MAAAIKTIVATGCSSGIGFEAIKQLLGETQKYRFILGARDTSGTEAAFHKLSFDRTAHSLDILPLQLTDLNSVNEFAQTTLSKIGRDNSGIDYLLLNAATSMGSQKPGSHGSKWSDAYITNHLSQHYLLHLLREQLIASKARVIFVSSGAIRSVSDTSTLEASMLANSNVEPMKMYPLTKFVQLLGAHWWRRALSPQCRVIAVSPGLIPGTGLGRGSGREIPANLPDAKSVPEGARSVLAAFTREDLPADPQRIFLTSWGEWWEKDVYAPSLDEGLQERWCPGKEEIEREEGITV